MSFEGEIAEIDLIARLVELGGEKFTGAIRFENDGIIKILYFKGGDVLSASTNDRADSIDEILLRAGKVTREHVKQALAKRKESETLGDALLNLGFITRKELTWARRVQAIGVIRSIDAWQNGSYTIVSDYLPKREEGTLFPLPQIIVELVVTDQDRVKFDRLLDGGEAVFAKAPDFDETFRRLGLNEDASKITNEVDGRRTAADVATAAGSDTFNVYKLLQALGALGLLQRVAKPEVTHEVSFDTADDLASAGVADASDMWTSTSPTFELDDSPSFDPMADAGPDLPMMGFDAPLSEPEPLPVPSPVAYTAPPAYSAPVPEPANDHSAWDDPAPPEAPGGMPAWDDAPVAAPMMAAPPPIPMPPSRPIREEFGGFDEAQIETARRAAVPLSSSLAGADEPSMAEAVEEASRPNRWVKTLLLAVGIVLVGFAGYAGFLWWQGQQTTSTAELTPRPVTKRPALRPTPAAGLTETVVTGTTVTGVASALPASATSSAPVTGTSTTAATTSTVPVSVPRTTATTTAGTTATTGSRPGVPGTTSVATTRSAGQAGAPVLHTPVQTATASPIANNAAASANDPRRAAYEAQARQHAAAPPAGNYTVQFELVCQTSSLNTAVRAGGDRIWFVPTTYRGQSCYRVFFGAYPTAEAAREGAGELPAGLRGGAAPVVVRVPGR
jgi:septal ring-binding cell division protein DamX